jgi:hypothetical protein
MPVTRAPILMLLLVCALPGFVQAQAAEDTVEVPVGLLEVLGVPVAENQPFALLRGIRVLHSLPRRDPVPASVADFERLLAALDRLERELAPTGARALAVAMASSSNRRAFADSLAALGLHMREDQRSYSVQPAEGAPAHALRALLSRIGIDTDAIQQRLNAGETVTIMPPTVSLPLPLPFERWAADVFAREVAPHGLFNAILRSREASLLYYGVQTMTADTRAYLRKTPELVKWLHGRAPLVAAFGSAFRVGADGRVQMPGGAPAQELWESLAGEKLTGPLQFARALFGRDDGRLAYFAESLWALDEVHARFALGLWLDDHRLRKDRFLTLYSVFAQMDPWSPANVPFSRPSYDAGLLLAELQLNESGLMVLPHRTLWEHAVAADEIPPADDRQMREPAAHGSADAAFLSGLLAGKLARHRRVVLEQIAFGQRNFAGSADAEMHDVLAALRGYRRFPAAMLALERIGLRKPAHFALAARRALAFEAVDGANAVPLLAQFQGSLALLEKLARTGALTPPQLEQLTTSLIAIDFDDGEYGGRVAEWLRSGLIESLPKSASRTAEARLLDALVDRMPPTAAFSWEGQEYVLDTSRQRRELAALRERERGNTLDALFAMYEHVVTISGPSPTVEAVKSRAAAIRAGAAALTAARPWPDAVNRLPAIDKVANRAAKELDRVRRDTDLRRAPRIAAPLLDALDYLLGETLVAIAYAASLGDTGRGPAAMVDVSHRHVFGTTTTLSENPRLVPWRRPARGGGAAAGDGIRGSLLGIDLALSRTRLRRMRDGLPGTPTLTGNDRETLTETVALLNPRLVDDTRGAQIGEAVRRGRARVEQAASDPPALDALAVEARISPARRGLLEWTSRYARHDVTGMFSVAELFSLGGGQRAAIDAWGTSHEAVTGCF